MARMNGRSRAAYGNVLVAALILALTYLITSVIVCTMVTAPRYKYAVGDTVEKTIYATKTIENELATEYLRNSARASVANIYMIDGPLITKQLERLDAGDERPVAPAADDGLPVNAAHENAFNERLPADACAEGRGGSGFLCHRKYSFVMMPCAAASP